ncbi:uncharacterized protein SOCE26_091690 [Sorangium cellulosum]|uniref:Uncharacterized protein n=1 Tax=Sorangium cellulosum TaxID=56 RepID=A0A2L0F801_SORCE|nr:uncharacterized protein SOCE26_091690 [Sorangium cellulosum]
MITEEREAEILCASSMRHLRLVWRASIDELLPAGRTFVVLSAKNVSHFVASGQASSFVQAYVRNSTNLPFCTL